MRILAILIASGATAQAAASTPLIPAADFAADPALEAPILSADGNLVAARSAIGGVHKILLFDTTRPDTPPKAIPLADATVIDLRFAGSQRLLLTVKVMRNLGSIKIPLLRLIAVDLPSGASRIMDSKSRGILGGDVLYVDKGGTWALVASQDGIYSYPSVKRVDLATGKATVVEKARDNVWDWYADDTGTVRAGIAYRGRRWKIWYRETANQPLTPIKGQVEQDDDSAIDRMIFGPKDSGWILTNEKTGRFALYKYDFKAGQIGEAVYEHPEVDIEDVIYEPFSGKLIGISYDDDRHHTVWLDPDRKSLQAKLDRALPGAINTVADESADGEKLLVWSGGASDPGTYFLLNKTTSRMSPILAPYERIDAARLAPVTSVKYQARDGLNVPAYLTIPRGREAKGLPLIVLPHGGPFERDDWSYDPLVQFLANRGYAVFQPQFRGSTGYGKAFVEKGYGQFGRAMQDDLDDGIDWLARSGQIDPKRVCIVGISYGGYAAMWGAVRNPERYRCAVSYAGISDLTALLRHDRSIFSAKRYYREWRARVAGDGSTDLASVSPVKFAASIKVPLLIGHGAHDERVPVEQSEAMIKAMEKANGKVTSIIYKDAGHDFGTAQNLEDWLRRLEHFLASNNPA